MLYRMKMTMKMTIVESSIDISELRIFLIDFEFSGNDIALFNTGSDDYLNLFDNDSYNKSDNDFDAHDANVEYSDLFDNGNNNNNNPNVNFDTYCIIPMVMLVS